MEVGISPAGRLRLIDDRIATDGKQKRKSDLSTSETLWLDAFNDSSAAGLLALQRFAAETANGNSASIGFWRTFGQGFLHRLCHQPKTVPKQLATACSKLAAPSPDDLQQVIDSAPPMFGLDFLTVRLLETLWSELAQLVSGQVAAADEPGQYLKSINPQFHLLGRVTFHLAENQSDPDRPFAFMATYTNRVSKSSKLQHLPLGQAVKQYAGQQNRETLRSLLSPITRAADHDALTRELLDSKAIFHPQAWTVGQAHRLLQAGDVLESSGVVLRLPDWWSKGKSHRVVVNVEVGNKQPSHVGTDSLLNFSANLALDGESLTVKETEQLLSEDAPLILLRGQWVQVDRDKLQQTLDHWEALSESNPGGIDFLAGMRLISGVQVKGDEAELGVDPEWQFVGAGDWLHERLNELRDPDKADNKRLARGLNATLRPYQQTGLQWMWLLTQLGIGGCLADDMGLGKTIQVIALLLSIKSQKTRNDRSSLLVVPASLVGNWRQEIEKFAPSLNVFYAHPSETPRDEIDALSGAQKQADDYDLVVTTYGLARRWKWLAEFDWKLVVLDEAQAIKNSGSAQSRAIKKLRSDVRFALTGTPVENHVGDLWSLFDFCCPGLLGSARQFKSYVNRLQKSEQPRAFAPLRRLVQPYILRRMKTDPEIAPELPGKTEMRCECTLSKKQVALYQNAVQQLERQLEADEVSGIARRGLVLSSLMQFKQICNHPSQFLGKSDFALEDSGKLQRLSELCRVIREHQDKLLLFTQFRGITESLASFLEDEFGHPGLVLHGGTNVKRRKQMVTEFQKDGGPSFFVISLKAGGTGLNLTAASHVIHFDRWWNPAVENQATDRAFRIGQKNKVLVHKFVCRGTIEESIDRMLVEKQEVSDEVLGNDPQAGSKALTELDNDELIKLISLDINRASAT